MCRKVLPAPRPHANVRSLFNSCRATTRYYYTKTRPRSEMLIKEGMPYVYHSTLYQKRQARPDVTNMTHATMHRYDTGYCSHLVALS